MDDMNEMNGMNEKKSLCCVVLCCVVFVFVVFVCLFV